MEAGRNGGSLLVGEVAVMGKSLVVRKVAVMGELLVLGEVAVMGESLVLGGIAGAGGSSSDMGLVVMGRLTHAITVTRLPSRHTHKHYCK